MIDTVKLQPHEKHEKVVAMIHGEETPLPQDLYIPPDALQIVLKEAFSGPLDLLLYLIRHQNLDILDIPVAQITQQYLTYIEMMQELSIDLVAEYMVMAAMLAEIKSRMLLPKPVSDNDQEDEDNDPRIELVRRLQEYERYRQLANTLDELPRLGRDNFQITIEVADRIVVRKLPEASLQGLLKAYTRLLNRAQVNQSHRIQMEVLSVRERMSEVLTKLSEDQFSAFQDLFDLREGRLGVVTTFLALLEMLKEKLIVIKQLGPYDEMQVKMATAKDGRY